MKRGGKDLRHRLDNTTTEASSLVRISEVILHGSYRASLTNPVGKQRCSFYLLLFFLTSDLWMWSMEFYEQCVCIYFREAGLDGLLRSCPRKESHFLHTYPSTMWVSHFPIKTWNQFPESKLVRRDEMCKFWGFDISAFTLLRHHAQKENSVSLHGREPRPPSTVGIINCQVLGKGKLDHPVPGEQVMSPGFAPAETRRRITQLSPTQISDLQNCEEINGCCSKQLWFEVVC